MEFISTRGISKVNNASEAIVKGLADDGGLFVPATFPDFSNKIKDLLPMDYPERAASVLSSYLEEYDYNSLLDACKNAYSKFEENDAAPVVKLDDDLFVLELFHGPTLAFKDIALTLLPYLLRKGCDQIGVKEEVLILVATSGDTGKAALEGFKNQKGVKINVFYPNEGVSDMQKMQMATTEGDNVNVIAVEGNFDDCQTAVKNIFNSKKCNEILKEKGVILSSANSINFGRLAPQIAYYFSAYCDLVNAGEIELGNKIDFVVPTGNFGNILAGYYAKNMGLPINKLICASNKNNILTDFFENGEYNVNREFYKTTSPSMDILISSNLERLIFEITGRNGALTKERMDSLKNNGVYSITEFERKKLSNEFFAHYMSEKEVAKITGIFFEDYDYLLDPHTAVAIGVMFNYHRRTDSELPIVILSTASPYKFSQSVLSFLTGETKKDAFLSATELEEISALPIPNQIKELKSKKIRFNKVLEKEQLFEEVVNFIEK